MAFTWDGDAMIPRYPKIADQTYVVGETYLLLGHNERSGRSHRHYFAALHAAWMSLPEGIAERFPTEDHLRRYALIKCGFYDERSIVAASKAEARRIAAFIKPMDDFAIVVVMEATVVVYTAKSQSLAAMGAAVFQQSKSKVLELVAAMVGSSAAKVKQAADNI